MPSLRIISGKEAGKLLEFEGPIVHLGRDASCGMHLDDNEVSRDHATLQRVAEGIELRDLGSSNGTFVNDIRITACFLKHADRLRLGKTVLSFIDDERNLAGSTHHFVDIVLPHESKDLSEIRRSISMDTTMPTPAIDVPKNASGNVEDSMVLRNQSHWEIMCRTAVMVSRTLDTEELLEQILDLIFQWLECDRGCVMLFDETTGRLQPACRKNRPNVKLGDRMSISQTILDYVIQHQQGVLTSNAGNDDRWDAAASILHLGIREAICVPMQGRYGVVGAIYIDTSLSQGQYALDGIKNRFRDEHLQLMVAIGSQAALAIEDTFYYRGMLQAERLAVMGQTIAGLSHHIKNILQGLHGGSYLVQEGIKKENLATISKGWRIVEKNQERIASMVMDMLSFSKERKPQPTEADLRETVDDVIELVQSRAAEADVQLEWKRPVTFPPVHFDAEAIHRAILNVVGNAIDATQGTPNAMIRITLDLRPSSDFVSLRISDNGPGIAPEDMERIFALFESSKGSRGTGLGLPVSQKILREHGGDILVESISGSGSTFTLQWPVKMDSSSPRETLPDRPTKLDAM